MTREEIIQKLEQNGFKNDSAATQIHHYTKTRRQSLTKGQVDNRNSTGWGRGEYVVIGYEDDGIPTWTLLAGWKKLTAKYKNQYLILEVSEATGKSTTMMGKSWGTMTISRICSVVESPVMSLCRRYSSDVRERESHIVSIRKYVKRARKIYTLNI